MGQFLVSSNLVTEQIKHILKTDKGELGHVLIVRIAGYAGWHSKQMWQWIESKTSGGVANVA